MKQSEQGNQRGQRIAHSIDDLAAFLWVDESEEEEETLDAFENRMSRAIYKSTDCGAWLEFLRRSPGSWEAAEVVGVKVGSIVEGSEAAIGPYELLFPFDMAEFEDVLRVVEYEAEAEWKLTNGDDDWLGLADEEDEAEGEASDDEGE